MNLVLLYLPITSFNKMSIALYLLITSFNKTSIALYLLFSSLLVSLFIDFCGSRKTGRIGGRREYSMTKKLWGNIIP
jgi:hypothetical protein